MNAIAKKPQQYTLTIEIEVNDVNALWQAARESALSMGIKDSEMDMYIGSESEPDIGACLVMVGDPGEPWGGTMIIECNLEPHE